MADPGADAEAQAVLLLVDDNATNLQVLFQTLNGRGYKLLIARDGEKALQIAKAQRPSLILLDIQMPPGIDGYEVCRRLKADEETAGSAVIFLSALDDTKDKVKGFEVGAVDYVSKPFRAEEVIARVSTHLTIRRLQQEVQERNKALEHELQVAEELVRDASVRLEGPLLGDSTAVRDLRARIASVAESDATVVLTGVPGSGHEAVARAVHEQSARRGRAFLYLNCMSLGDEAAKTLVGTTGGLFGMGEAKPGKWDLAAGGTLFLDQLESIPAAAQKPLLKKLRQRGAGSNRPRVIAYAAQDLENTSGFEPELWGEFKDGSLLEVPSLSDRLDDIPVLVQHFVRRKAGSLGRAIEKVSKSALKRLKKHAWTGSISELSSIIDCALVASTSPVLEIDESLFSGGRRVGNYRLVDLLGKGGMGEVWSAKHELLRRPAAVKLILGKSIGDALARDKALKRFEREAQVTAALRSPNTVQLFDYGISDDGDIYYVMELLEGLDLQSLVTKYGPVPPERAIALIRQTCRSLAEAHEAGLVHRDIKPANIFAGHLGPEFDFVKVLDFGIVKVSQEDADPNLTGMQIVGSPAFMSPESVMGKKEIDGRADLYGLGCVLFWLVTGRKVFEADTVPAMCVMHASQPPPAPSSVADMPLPPGFDAAVLACLQKEPGDRPATANDLWRRLGAIPTEQPWDQDRAEAWWKKTLPELV